MKWQIDPVHSSLTFGVRHMMVTNVRGSIGGLNGTLEFDPERPHEGTLELTADPRTISTGEAKRDGHLRSGDFFDADAYPEVRFRSTGIMRVGDDLKVNGELTIRGVTKPISATAMLDGVLDDPRGGKRAGFSATATIDRREWGLVWNQPIANGVLVGEKVKIELELAAVQVQPEAQATKAA